MEKGKVKVMDQDELMGVIQNNVSEVKDPLIRKGLTELVTVMELQKKFKRIDIAFLQMTVQIDSGQMAPRFAILPYDVYGIEYATCEFNMNCFNWSYMKDRQNQHPIVPEIIAGHIRRGMNNKLQATMQTANPPSDIPKTVAAKVEEVKGKFDQLYVAWEADWAPGGDPIVLGQKGDYWFIIDKWDVTKLESYVISEF